MAEFGRRGISQEGGMGTRKLYSAMPIYYNDEDNGRAGKHSGPPAYTTIVGDTIDRGEYDFRATSRCY